MDLCSGGMIWSCCVDEEVHPASNPNQGAIKNASKLKFSFRDSLFFWSAPNYSSNYPNYNNNNGNNRNNSFNLHLSILLCFSFRNNSSATRLKESFFMLHCIVEKSVQKKKQVREGGFLHVP